MDGVMRGISGRSWVLGSINRIGFDVIFHF